MTIPPLDAAGGDRFPEPIVEAWQRAGLAEPIAWPDRQQYQFRVPATEPEAGITALATVLDLTAAEPATLFVHLALGRQAPFGPQRRAVESLAGHTDIVVTDTQTAGAVDLAAFEALVGMGDLIEYALARDDNGRAIVEWLGDRLRFVLPVSAVDRLRSELGGADIERVDHTTK